jgi:serine/threonine protein kinase
VSKEGRDLLEKMLVINPNERITAAQALNHPYFKVDPQASSNEEIANLIKNYKSH